MSKPSETPEESLPVVPSHAAYVIVDHEARRDADGDVVAYYLPRNDGGAGNGLPYEFAGINGKWHAPAVRKLAAMHKSQREEYAARYIEDKTRKWTGFERGMFKAGTELFILDSAWNRGGQGSAYIAQNAIEDLGVSISVDGQWGPETRKKLKDLEHDRPVELIKALRKSRERYEVEVVGYRANLWKGLVNRWNDITATAIGWNAA